MNASCTTSSALGLIANKQQRQPEKSGAVGPEQVADELVSLGPLMVCDARAS
jgi:hypothetical protein